LIRKIGASEGIRTLDIHVGNVTLYQTELRSLPTKLRNGKGTPINCKPFFDDHFHWALGGILLPIRVQFLDLTVQVLNLPGVQPIAGQSFQFSFGDAGVLAVGRLH
jgi:hypothetical protein